jgi:hypothetical protein
MGNNNNNNQDSQTYNGIKQDDDGLPRVYPNSLSGNPNASGVVKVDSRQGTRTTPKDAYKFLRGTTANFRITTTSGNMPIDVDAGTVPIANILQPAFLNTQTPVQGIIANVMGSKVPGTQFEYEFNWVVPTNLPPDDLYVIQYKVFLGGVEYVAGDEFFTISVTPETLGTYDYGYCTVQDVRLMKANIDSYFPQVVATDINRRNEMILFHIKTGTDFLREQLNLAQARGFSANYRLFTIYYAIWSIMNNSYGEDGSSVSIERLDHYAKIWGDILAQEKRKGIGQGISYGRG